jgi:hypothetical protein
VIALFDLPLTWKKIRMLLLSANTIALLQLRSKAINALLCLQWFK